MKKAIIFIPGVCCSTLINKKDEKVWITDNKLDGEKQYKYLIGGTLKCSKDGEGIHSIVPEQGENVYGILDICKPIITTLQNEFKHEYDIIYKQYDWRLDNLRTVKEVKKIVDNYDKVSLIGHSMGGMIINKFLETYGYEKVEKIVTLGTPYIGSVCVSKVIYDGDLSVLASALSSPIDEVMESNFKNYTTFYELLPNHAYMEKGKWLITNNEEVNKWYQYLWSCFGDKLNNKKETEKVLKANLNETLVEKAKKFDKTILDADVVKNHLEYTIISGDGLYTIETMKYINNGEVRIAIPSYSKKGDGTVSIYSSTMANKLPWIRREGIDHIGLLFDQETLSQVVQILKGEKLEKVENFTYDPLEEIFNTGFKNRFTFAGDVDLEILDNDNLIGNIHKEKIADTIFYRINCEDDIKINNIGTVKDERAFLVYFNEKAYKYKLKANKSQVIDIALGSDKKIYAFESVELNINDEVTISYGDEKNVQAVITYNNDSTPSHIINAKIIEL